MRFGTIWIVSWRAGVICFLSFLFFSLWIAGLELEFEGWMGLEWMWMWMWNWYADVYSPAGMWTGE